MRTSPIGWSRRSRAQGLSLLEMVVSLSIVSLFLSLIVVRIGPLTGYGDLREAARTVAAEITRRRAEAAYSHKEKLLGIDLDKGWVYAMEPDSAGDAENAKEPLPGDPERIRKAGRIRELPKGVRFIDVVLYPDKSVTKGEVRIRFFANGCAEDTMIRLKNDENQVYTLEVLAFNGEVTVYDHNVEMQERKQRLYPVRDHSLPDAHFDRPSERL